MTVRDDIRILGTGIVVLVTGTAALVELRPPADVAGLLLRLWWATVLAGTFWMAKGRDWLDIEWPARPEFRTVVSALAVYAVLLGVLSVGVALVDPGAEPASHEVFEPPEGEDTPEASPEDRTGADVGDGGSSESSGVNEPVLLATLAVAAPLLEELVFRNGLQKSIQRRTNAPVAIIATSVAFSVLHLSSYGGFAVGLGALAVPLVVIFGGSVIIGIAYWRTENLLVPISIHAVINGAAFLGQLL